MRSNSSNIAVLAIAILALSGCAKQPGWHSGTAVRFGAGARAESLTKTSYGAYSGGTVQMINWEESDMVRIACAQAEGSVKTADYQTSAGTAEGTSSIATLSLAAGSSSGLRWGSEGTTHTFYGVYPSPAVKSGDALTTGGQLTGNIPSVQTCDLGNGSTNTGWTSSPDMTLQYMVAKKSVTETDYDSDEVFLNFTPITTAIEFEVINAMDEQLTIASIDIISAGKNLSGTFTTSLETLSSDGGVCPAVAHTTSPSDATGTVRVQFSTGSSAAKPVLSSNAKLTFTVFLLPETDLNDLTFRINKMGGGYMQTSLKSSETSWFTFEKHKKHFIKGLLAKEGAKWTVCFDPSVDSWDNTDVNQGLNDPNLGSLSDLISWDQGEESSLNMRETPEAKFTFGDEGVSKTHTFTGTPSADGVTFDIISTMGDDSQDWKIKSVGGVAVDGTTYTTADGDLKVENVSGKLKITDKRQEVSYGDNAHWTTSGTDWYRPSLSGTIDLSKRDFRTGATTGMRTANCYIVRNAGTYTIPLVYGNAIDYGKSGLTNGNNVQAYNPTIASGGSNYLKPFVHHLEKSIFDPYIENNTDDGKAKWYQAESGKPGKKDYIPEDYNNFLVADNAAVVWQEPAGVISIVKNSSGGTIHGTKKTAGNTAYTDGAYNASSVRNIQFTVNQANIQQCNAVIAVRDASNNILWSWHIWVTNNPALDNQAIAVTNYAGNTSSFLTVPAIGWIDPDFYEEKDDVIIVLEQEDSGEQITVTVKQLEYCLEAKNPYYQFGRKDPMRYGITSDVNTGTTDIKTSILHPDAFYTAWTSGGYYNLWTGKESKIYTLAALTGNNSDAEEGANLIKTIYDPSPVGYKVPSTKAFTGFTTTGTKSSSVSDINAEGSYHKGWDFYTNSSSTIFFPVVYIRKNDGSKSTSAMGRYSTSTPNNDSGNSFFEFQFQSTYVYPMTEKSSRANALSVRPIEE